MAQLRRHGTGEWRPLTPEYGLRYLDVFFPGVWLPNLEQTPEIVRRWYCGTPLGEIEFAPIDAPAEILAQYKLLLLLGWNTMDEAQYRSLRAYVEQGGRLFMSVPHATGNESRRFLAEDLEPLNLVRNGDFRDLFGVAVKGRGPRLGRIQGDPAVADNPVGGFFQVSTTSTPPPVVPQHPLVDLAEVELAGAEVLATDLASGAPVLVRHRVGAGEAYLLCTHEYPGNSRLVPFVKPLVRALAQTTPWPVELEDVSGDVYYTVREEAEAGVQTIHLLNTDWTAAGNEKACRLRLGDAWVELAVREGRISAVTRCGALALLVEDDKVHLEEVCGGGQPGQRGVARLRVRRDQAAPAAGQDCLGCRRRDRRGAGGTGGMAERGSNLWLAQRDRAHRGAGTMTPGDATTRSLAGTWGFRLDPERRGVAERWFGGALPDSIALPGSTDDAGYGRENDAREVTYLTRTHVFEGQAWYQKEIEIPPQWAGKSVLLFLERCLWETELWVDEEPVGYCDSLLTPHVYDLTHRASPGAHRLTLMVDSTPRGTPKRFRNHAYTEHTQTVWNGVIGRIELSCRDPIHLADVQVYPNVAGRSIRIVSKIGNDAGGTAEGTPELQRAAEGLTRSNPGHRAAVVCGGGESTSPPS